MYNAEALCARKLGEDMNQTINYEQSSPLYDAVISNYQRNGSLYDGGESMESSRAVKQFLTQHPYEKTAQYEIRCKRAAYRNYAAPTVDLFASSVMDGSVRDGLDAVPVFTPMLANCNRQGNSPENFFKTVNTRAAAKGAEFVLVDMPQARGEARTQADAKEQGLAPYFVRIPAENIIDWGLDDNGSLSWVVQREMRQESPGPFQKYVTVKTITLWRTDGWTRYESRDSGVFEQVGDGAYSIGAVPIVPFLYEQESMMTGRSVIDDVASLIIRVFNQDSELDKMLFDAALPILAAFGLRSDEEEDALVKATSYLWRFGDINARLQYVEPSGTSFSAKRQQILDDIESIREISLRQTRPRGAGVESAESKRLDTVQISSQLADFARNCAAAEKRCWEIAGLYSGADTSGITVKYNEVFDPEALREKLTQAYMELRKDGDISRETVWEQLGWDEQRREEEKTRLAVEQEESARMSPNPTGTGGIAAAVTAVLQQRDSGEDAQ